MEEKNEVNRIQSKAKTKLVTSSKLEVSNGDKVIIWVVSVGWAEVSSFMNIFVSWAEIIWWSTRLSWSWLMVSLWTLLDL